MTHEELYFIKQVTITLTRIAETLERIDNNIAKLQVINERNNVNQ